MRTLTRFVRDAKNCKMSSANQYVGQELRHISGRLFGFTGEVFPDASPNRTGQENLCAGRNVIEASGSFAEVNLCRHLFIFEWSVIHGFSP